MFGNLKKLFNSITNNNSDEDICNLNKSKKRFYTAHEELLISSATDNVVKEVTEKAYTIMKQYKDTPLEILKYMEAEGAKVIVAPALYPALKYLGYDDGFNPKHSSLKAFLLNFAIRLITHEQTELSFNMPDVIFVCNKDVSLYFVAYNLYHWLSYKHNLPGYDYESWHLFKSTYENNAKELHLLSINQILALKDTMDRDKQACEFVLKFVQEQISTKERLENILEGKNVEL